VRHSEIFLAGTQKNSAVPKSILFQKSGINQREMLRQVDLKNKVKIKVVVHKTAYFLV